MKPGDWLRSRSFRDLVQVVEITEAFGVGSVRVWHPASARVAVVAMSDLVAGPEPDHVNTLIAAVAAARIADALAGGALIAPTQSVVEPLPHQLRALSRCVASDSTRMLLADEVGLGKTIEAGLVITELVLRGLVKRVLVVAPKGLVAQWQGELLHRFGEEYVALASAEVGALAGRREDNFWLAYDRLIIPLDAVTVVLFSLDIRTTKPRAVQFDAVGTPPRARKLAQPRAWPDSLIGLPPMRSARCTRNRHHTSRRCSHLLARSPS